MLHRSAGCCKTAVANLLSRLPVWLHRAKKLCVQAWFSIKMAAGFMRFIYNILFTAGFLLSAPYYFLKMWRRGNWRKNFRQRFGHYGSAIRAAITNSDVIWFHAVSVGEVNICTQLIKALEPRLPKLKIVVSTTTTTGMAELEKRLPSHILKIYYPVDFRRCVRRALAVLHPVAIILVEAEIWPNFLWRAGELGIPVFMVNARLSERSYAGYKRWGLLFRPIFAQFAGVGCQNEADAARLRELGCRPEAVRVVGNLKYDAAQLTERRMVDVAALLKQIGAPDNAQIIVGGSTHAGEERILASVYARLRKRFPNLFLVLVPRHFERAQDAGRDVASTGLKIIFKTQLTASSSYKPGEIDCLIVNTTGELRFFYERADIVFVGKSLTAEGGQNPIEPGALGKAIVFGPNMQNFAAIAAELVRRHGARIVQNEADLEHALEELLTDSAKREAMGRNALSVVQENLGAVERTIQMLAENLSTRGIQVLAAGPKPH